MSLHAFAGEIETDPQTLPLLREIARQAAADDAPAGPPPTYTDPVVAPFVVIAAIALYRGVDLVTDYVRGRAALDLADKQFALVRKLVAEDGIPHDKAEKAVAAALKVIHSRKADDSALKAVLEIAKKYTGNG